MVDTRFKDKKDFCKLCHKLCFDSKELADLFIEVAPALNRPLTYSYECSLYPSGYWHVTSVTRTWKVHHWRVELKKLGPEREKRLLKRIEHILSL